MKNRMMLLLSVLLSVIISAGDVLADADVPPKKFPVIYCADLFHPHEDPDDHFDIATLYAIPEIDIKAIILDQGKRQQAAPGSIPVSQMNYITGRNVPYAIGLSDELLTPHDQALGQPQEYQQGIELILSTLKNSTEPVTVITVGSLRDIAAAYNRDPQLLKTKIDRLFIFIGEASQKDYIDYNVNLDIHAYMCVMDSDLPVYWVPCFDGGIWQNKGNASYWNASHKDLLARAPETVLKFFIYALQKKDKNTIDPIRYLNDKLDTKGRDDILTANRHLWCSSVFTCISNRKIIRQDQNFISVPADTPCCQGQLVDLFTFKEVSIYVSQPVTILPIPQSDKARTVKIFQVTNKNIYEKAMTSIAADLLGQLGEN
jgi:hypothetical protein